MTTGRRLWVNARTLDDLGELTAQWLEGRISYLPAYRGDGPEPETKDLIPHLAAYNRAGYFTIASQPGVPLGESSGQRAFVDGFASEALVDTVETAILGTRLIALARPCGRDSSIRIPVTMDVGHAYTWVGSTYSLGDIMSFYSYDCPEAVQQIITARQLTVFDPVWGDNDLLWAKLDEALG